MKSSNTCETDMSDVPLQRRLKVIVTHINHPSSFYAQLGTESHLKSCSKLQQELTEWCDECSIQCTSFHAVNTYVAVRVLKNQQKVWARAMITKKLTNGVEVNLIDSGKSLVITSTDDVCGGKPPQLMSMAEQALHCRAIDIQQVDKWSEKVIDCFSDVVCGDYDLLGMVYPQSSDELWPVAIFYRDEGKWKSVGEYLEKQGLAKFNTFPDITEELLFLNSCIAQVDATSEQTHETSEQTHDFVNSHSNEKLSQERSDCSNNTEIVQWVAKDDERAGQVYSPILTQPVDSDVECNSSFDDDHCSSDGFQLEESQVVKTKDIAKETTDITTEVSVVSKYEARNKTDQILNAEKEKSSLKVQDSLPIEKEEEKPPRVINKQSPSVSTIPTPVKTPTPDHNNQKDSAVNVISGNESHPTLDCHEHSSDENEWDNDLLTAFPSPNKCDSSPNEGECGSSFNIEQKRRKQANLQLCFKALMNANSGSPNVKNDEHDISSRSSNGPKRFNKHSIRSHNPHNVPNTTDKSCLTGILDPSQYSIPVRCDGSKGYNHQGGPGILSGPGGFNQQNIGYKPWKKQQTPRMKKNKGGDRGVNNYQFGRGRGRGVVNNLPQRIPYQQQMFSSRGPQDVRNEYSFGEQVRITEKSDWSESVFSQPNLFQHRVCDLNNEALKNEMDWLSWKIESEVKKTLPLISDSSSFTTEIAAIIDGTSAKKFYSLGGALKRPIWIVLRSMLSWVLNRSCDVENVVLALYSLFVYNRSDVSSCLSGVFKEVFETFCKSHDIAEKRHLFCSVLGNLFLCASSIGSLEFSNVATTCIMQFLDEWINLLSTANEFENQSQSNAYVDCFVSLCGLVVPGLDRSDRGTLDKYFDTTIPLLIVETKLSQSARIAILNIVRSRERWIGQHLANEKSIHSQECSNAFVTNEIQVHPTVIPVSCDNELNNSLIMNPSTNVTNPNPSSRLRSMFDDGVQSSQGSSVNQPAPHNSMPQFSTGSYAKVTEILKSIGLPELIESFRSAKIQDSLLLAEKDELRSVLKDAGIPPGAVLSILRTLEMLDTHKTHPEIQQSSYLQKHLVNMEQNIVPTYSFHSIPLDSHFQGINVQTQKGLIDGSILSYNSPQGTFKYLPDQYMVQQQLQHQQSIAGKSPNSDSALQLQSLQSPSGSKERNPVTNLLSEPSVHIMTPSQSFLRVNNMQPQQSPQRPYQYSSDQHHSHVYSPVPVIPSNYISRNPSLSECSSQLICAVCGSKTHNSKVCPQKS